MHTSLSTLPVAMHETDKPVLHPQTMALELLEKMSDRTLYIAHADQSLNTIDNIKIMLTIQSYGRIQFTK